MSDKTTRPSWDDYFMDIAFAAAKRATCPRKRVGAVIAKNKNILTTGYNGSLPDFDHCDNVGCDIKNNHCVRTIHAEVNAILQAAKNGTCIDGATLYVTARPCDNCAKLAAGAGIVKILYSEEYGGPQGNDFGIIIERLVKNV